MHTPVNVINVFFCTIMYDVMFDKMHSDIHHTQCSDQSTSTAADSPSTALIEVQLTSQQ